MGSVSIRPVRGSQARRLAVVRLRRLLVVDSSLNALRRLRHSGSAWRMIIFQTDPAPAPAALIPTSPLSPHSKDVGVVTNVAWQSGPDAALALDHDAQLKVAEALQATRRAINLLRNFEDVLMNQTYLPSYGEHKNIYIGDAVSSTQDDKEKPITSGFFRVEKGGKATATYTYFEVKVIVEDTLIVSDGTGQKVTAVKGDILYFPKDSTIFIVGARQPTEEQTLITFYAEPA
ncbi:hypothetical protein MBLNU459_g8295t2 [Dothideomycetes sp. NU459]